MFAEGHVPADLPSTRAPRICGICTRHQGQLEHDLRKRLKDHIELWQFALEERTEELESRRAADVGRLEAVIAHLRQELVDRPVQVVNKYVGQELIDQAEEDRRRAYTSRDRAFQLLSLLHMEHFESSTGRCRCGRSADDCYVAQMLDSSKALRIWERNQSLRRKRGLSSWLPRDHPGILDARWDPDDHTFTDIVEELDDRDLDMPPPSAPTV